MRFFPAALMACLLAASSGVALAAVQTGNEVSVNPVAGAGNVLLYPGGQYMRVVHPLMQPGEKSGPIQLHMPGKRTAVRTPVTRAPAAPRAAAIAPPAPPPRRVASAPPPKPAPAPKPAPVRPAPAPQAAPEQSYGGFGAPQSSAGMALPLLPKRTAKAEPAPDAGAMSNEPLAPGLTKQSVILLAAGATDPAKSALGSIKFLAGDLNNLMTNPGSRVQLIAYGGAKGDKGSDARRLSLKRALAIRQVLIDDGVPSERIDVRAMGGADDGGPADRVDVYVKA